MASYGLLQEKIVLLREGRGKHGRLMESEPLWANYDRPPEFSR